MTARKNQQQFQELETLTVLAAFLLLLNLLLHQNALVVAALALLIIGLFVKPIASIISRSWLKLAEILGSFNSKILLSLVFILFLTPLAFLFRFFTRNPLQLKRDNNLRSLYLERKHRYIRKDFEKMW